MLVVNKTSIVKQLVVYFIRLLAMIFLVIVCNDQITNTTGVDLNTGISYHRLQSALGPFTSCRKFQLLKEEIRWEGSSSDPLNK